MTTAWPEPVERVADFLRQAGAEARIEEFREDTPTAADAARAAGCGPDQIVKSVVVMAEGSPVLTLVPGDRRLDVKKVARTLGVRKVRIATPDEVEAATGFVPGAVAPFPLPKVQRALCEQSLLALPLVWVGAGSTRHLASLPPRELVRLARAEPMDVVSEPTYDSASVQGES